MYSIVGLNMFINAIKDLNWMREQRKMKKKIVDETFAKVNWMKEC